MERANDMRVIVIKIPEEHYRTLQNAMKNHMESLIGKIILNGTLILDNATNEKGIDDIKVGDEVIVQVDKIGVVTGFDVLYDGVYVTTKDGWSDRFGKSFVKKTGRHFDEIENVLRQMRKGDVDDK